MLWRLSLLNKLASLISKTAVEDFADEQDPI